jgi:hypothetical protein
MIFEYKYAFDVRTGAFRELKAEDKLSNFEIKTASLPKPNCYHCYGRGYIGIDVKSGFKVPCRCLKGKHRQTVSIEKLKELAQAMKEDVSKEEPKSNG